MPSAEFWENKAGLPQGFIPRRYALFRCFRPGFSVRGSRRGSKRDPRRKNKLEPDGEIQQRQR